MQAVLNLSSIASPYLFPFARTITPDFPAARNIQECCQEFQIRSCCEPDKPFPHHDTPVGDRDLSQPGIGNHLALADDADAKALGYGFTHGFAAVDLRHI